MLGSQFVLPKHNPHWLFIIVLWCHYIWMVWGQISRKIRNILCKLLFLLLCWIVGIYFGDKKFLFPTRTGGICLILWTKGCSLPQQSKRKISTLFTRNPVQFPLKLIDIDCPFCIFWCSILPLGLLPWYTFLANCF